MYNCCYNDKLVSHHNNNKMKELDENIIIRFIQGRCSDDELRAVKEWIDVSGDNRDELFRMEKLYRDMAASTVKPAKINAAMKRVENKAMRDYAAESGDASVSRHRNALTVALSYCRRYAAAVLVLLVAGAALWYMSRPKAAITEAETIVSVSAPSNATREVVLPDGTRLWLNRGATVSYPESFSDTLRRVRLKGEAYFEVAKNAAKPFVVSSDNMSVRVLGTIFNFNTGSPSRPVAEVSLIEGSVEASSLKSPGQVVLSPGQKACLDYAAGRLTVENVDPRIDAVWHSGMIPFDNATVSDIARTLERLYGVHIIVDSSVDSRRTYSGAIVRKGDIDSVLQLLHYTLPIIHRHDGNRIIISSRKG